MNDGKNIKWYIEHTNPPVYVLNSLNKAIKALEQQSSGDCISREAAIGIVAHIKEMHIDNRERHQINYGTICDIDLALQQLPSVTPQLKIGKWIIDDKEYNRIWHCHCSNCKKDPQDYIGGTENWWLVRLPDYCPNCGAKMEVEE